MHRSDLGGFGDVHRSDLEGIGDVHRSDLGGFGEFTPENNILTLSRPRKNPGYTRVSPPCGAERR